MAHPRAWLHRPGAPLTQLALKHRNHSARALEERRIWLPHTQKHTLAHLGEIARGKFEGARIVQVAFRLCQVEHILGTRGCHIHQPALLFLAIFTALADSAVAREDTLREPNHEYRRKLQTLGLMDRHQLYAAAVGLHVDVAVEHRLLQIGLESAVGILVVARLEFLHGIYQLR